MPLNRLLKRSVAFVRASSALEGLPKGGGVLGPLSNSRVASSSDVVSKLSGPSGLPGGGPGLAVQEGDGAVFLSHSAVFLAP
eukprot:6137663-Alexandrium_andersonii.AAC.1